MRHDLTLEGHAFRLRPIKCDDAEFVIELRGNPSLNRYLHASSNQIDDQLAWLARYFEREGDFYFVIERRANNTPEGVIAVYDIDPVASSGEWGRWVLTSGSLAAIESAYLIYRMAFELLGLKSAYCRTVADNSKVVSFHDSCGVITRRRLPDHFELCGQKLDAIEHRVNVEDWSEIGPRLDNLARLTAKRINRA